jgi:hypothetical protein
MSVRTRVAILTATAASLALGAAGCASGSASNVGTGDLGTLAGASTAPTAQPSASPPAKPAVAALKCAQLKSAEVGSATVSYNGYHDGIPLGGLGLWSGEDGNTVTLESPCGIGDLDGDGAKDAVGVVSLTSGGTGDFYTLVVWHNKNAKPVCVAVTDLGDRNPVKSIAIANRRATIVYFTRTNDAPMAELNIQRTAVFKLSGGRFSEISHVDVAGEFNG